MIGRFGDAAVVIMVVALFVLVDIAFTIAAIKLYVEATPDDPAPVATPTPACHRVGETASGAVLMECP